MLVAIIGFLILLIVAFFCGSLMFPTRDELTLILSAFCLFVVTWFYTREKRVLKGEKEEAKGRK